MEALAEHHNALNPLPGVVYPVFSIPDAVERYVVGASSGDGLVCAAFLEEKMIGFAAIAFSGWNGDIDYLYLSPECRGYGVGKRLIQWALEEFKTRNLRYAHLKVVLGNDDSIAFYEHCGFEPRALAMVRTL